MITTDPALLAAAAELRSEVFVVGQGVAPEVEADGADPTATHSVLTEGEGEGEGKGKGEGEGSGDGDGSESGGSGASVVATGRFVVEPGAGPVGAARLGRIAVRPDRRGRGLGGAVVAELVGAARAAGLTRLRLHAQDPVVEFYARLGWSVAGSSDVEAGIAHRWMTRDLLPGLRPVADADAGDLQALVAGCFAAYPGAVLETDGLDAWMLAPATGAAAKGATVLVVPAGSGGLAASGGWQPGGAPDARELKTMYVRADHRRRGLAAALVGVAERTARADGMARMELWTDTRFVEAHALYERAGYLRQPGTRELHDRSQTVEYPYAKIL